MKRIYFLLLSAGTLFIFSECRHTYHLAEGKSQTYRINQQLSADDSSTVAKMIEPYRNILGQEMDDSIGFCKTEMQKSKPESTLGNWTSDAILNYCESYMNQSFDFAVVNYGGIRISTLPKGKVTRRKIYELMPFDNYLLILELGAKDVRKLFDVIAGSGGWPVSKGIQLTIKGKEVESLQIGGASLSDQKKYTLVISDYIANGGDGCFFFKDLPRVNTNILFRDALIDYIEKMNPVLESAIENRINVL